MGAGFERIDWIEQTNEMNLFTPFSVSCCGCWSKTEGDNSPRIWPYCEWMNESNWLEWINELNELNELN